MAGFRTKVHQCLDFVGNIQFLQYVKSGFDGWHSAGTLLHNLLRCKRHQGIHTAADVV